MLPNVGIENAIGDYVVFLRPTVDPIDLIHSMIQDSSYGYDIIIGIADYPKTLSYKIIRKISSQILQTIDYHLPQNATPACCLSRKAINTILRTWQNRRQFFSQLPIFGYSIKSHEYDLLNSSNLKAKTLLSGIRDVLKLMVLNSTRLVRNISAFGVLGSLCSFLFASYSILINLVKDDVVEGWTTIIFFFSVLFMMLFIILAFLGEYMESLFGEICNKNRFYISDEERSTFMIEVNRVNVFD